MRRLALVAIAAVAACSTEAPAAETLETQPVERLRVEVIETYPHDTTAFTQGLELHGGVLYEGTGLHGQSRIRTVDYQTGEVLQEVALPETVFGEGITIVEDQIWQITWQEQIAFRRDRETLAEIEQVSYTGEGWGICHDPDSNRLIMSDGTDRLTFRDPETFEPTGTVSVTRDGQPVFQINELECVGDQVWANIWQTDEIVRIDPSSGTVTAVVDAAGLLTPEERATTDVLNGIAAVPDTDTFLVTGKLWPKLFLVRFVPA
jgi:glutamine cyclotransferase